MARDVPSAWDSTSTGPSSGPSHWKLSSAASAIFPAKNILRNPLGRRHRQRIPKGNTARHLERGQPLGGERLESGLIGAAPLAEHNNREDLFLLQPGVDANDRHRLHGGMRSPHILDLSRRDVLATPANHLLVAPTDKDVAVAVAVAGIAGMQPAVRERCSRDLRR